MTNKKRHLILKINSIHFWRRVSVWKSCFDNFTSKIEFYIPDWLPKLNIHRKTCQGPFLRSSIEFFLRLNFEKLVVFFRNLLNLFILFDFRLPWISPKEFVFAFKLKNFCWSGELNLFINIWMKEKKKWKFKCPISSNMLFLYFRNTCIHPERLILLFNSRNP